MLLVILFYYSSKSIAQSNPPSIAHDARTNRAIGKITELYKGHNRSFTKITFYANNSTHTIRLDGLIAHYNLGDKLIVKYNPLNCSNALPIIEHPYFAPGELQDTTEGIIHFTNHSSCIIYYKTIDPFDNLNIRMISKFRYLSDRMFDTLPIKTNYVYRISYNKKNIDTNFVEILFKEIKDSTHLKLNQHLYNGLIKLSGNNSNEAIGDLSYCISTDSNNSFYYFQRAKAYENSYKIDEAIQDFSKYIQLEPTDKRGYLRRAAIYMREGNYTDAQRDITALLSLDSSDAETYYVQGQIYFHNKEYQNAIDSYTNALKYSNDAQKEFYYHSRAIARENLNGGNSRSNEIKYDRLMEKKEAKKYIAKMYNEYKTHPTKLIYNNHSLYGIVSFENSFNPYYARYSNMQGELNLPYTLDNNNKNFDKTFAINKLKHSDAISLGISAEVGGSNRLYGRIEASKVLHFDDKGGFTGAIKGVLGYNIKVTKKNIFTIRPEIGCSYLNRHINIGNIQFNGKKSHIDILGKNFSYGTSRKQHYDQVDISFCENVFNFTPALGILICPEKSSTLILKLSVGYNWNLYQNYSISYNSNINHLRDPINNVNVLFSNTNGKYNNFFNYQGLFISIGIGFFTRE